MSPRIAQLLAPALLATLVFDAGAGPHTFFGGIGNDANIEVRSYKEAKYSSVIPQQYDFSCGSAALATLLTYHYDMPTTEAETFEAMYRAGDQQKIQRVGFSLLDMKRYLASRGLDSDGYKISLQKLADTGVPAIVLINTGGYKHFVVVKGIQDGAVLVGDPAKGLSKIPVQKFSQMSEGIVFLIKNEAKIARASFNNRADWNVTPRGPLRSPDGHTGISNFPVMLPRPTDF